MKKLLLFIILFLSNGYANAETFIVEVGGNQNVTPYYLPQFLTINIGDTVIWDFVLGTHNVTTTSGPVTIDSGDLQSPNEFMFIFEVAGTYDYECTLFDHADTQFGTITVLSPEGIEEGSLIEELDLYPNPATDNLNYAISDNIDVEGLYIITTAGVRTNNAYWSKGDKTIDVSDLKSGIYILIMETSTGIVRKKFHVEK
ncbi:MAG: plastocyanin [Patiriisocius sp.]|jgi:plastocyanin